MAYEQVGFWEAAVYRDEGGKTRTALFNAAEGAGWRPPNHGPIVIDAPGTLTAVVTAYAEVACDPGRFITKFTEPLARRTVVGSSYREDYAPPWVSPEGCDHEDYEAGARGFCSHCCPCPECGAERYAQERQ